MTERQVGSSDAEYPDRLDGIDGMPDTLWVHGTVSLNPDRTVAIVGTRSPFHLSAEVVQAVGRVATKLGYTIVSGYATGIDTAGHWGAADEDAPTIAVLGSGMRQKEPLKPALERYILSKGVFVSAVPDPNARRASKHLLDRNRITAALADVVIVVETNPEGGAAATARFAREHERKVYAVVWHGHEDYEILDVGEVTTSSCKVSQDRCIFSTIGRNMPAQTWRRSYDVLYFENRGCGCSSLTKRLQPPLVPRAADLRC